MKKLIIVTATALASMGAFAQVAVTADSASQSYSSTSSQSTVSGVSSISQGGKGGTATNGSASSANAQSITFTAPADTTSNIVYSGEQTIKNVPSVSGPNLTTSNDTCMGSTSGSVNIAGLGIGGGSTWTDANCKMLKNSRELWNMGMKAAAMALMCTDPANKEALELTGYICPSKSPSAKSTEVPTSKAETTEQYASNSTTVSIQRTISAQ